jgi:methionyl-tRNA synthetase
MSKSKGTFVRAETYLKHLDPAFLRYYYASKLGSRLDDLDLNLDEFVAKVNADLVGKVVNLASRSARFVQDLGLSATYPDDGGLFAHAARLGDDIAAAYDDCDFNRAMRLVMELADRANPYVEAAEPWNLRKDAAKTTQLQDVCTVALNLFRQLAIYLAPVLPRLAEQTSQLLNTPIRQWDESKTPLTGVPVAAFQHMLKRVEKKDVEKMIEDSREPEIVEPAVGPQWQDSDEPLKNEPLAEPCTIDDFTKLDLRVARVVAAEDVPEAKKLLKLTVSLGGDVRRTLFAGIKEVYKPEDLVGKLVVVAANLAPRKMKFGVSEGMVTAAGAGGQDIFLLRVDDGAQPGHRVH